MHAVFGPRIKNPLAIAPDGEPTVLHEEPLEFHGKDDSSRSAATDVLIPRIIRLNRRKLRPLCTITTFGTPLGITVDDIAIESYDPADAAAQPGDVSAAVGLWKNYVHQPERDLWHDYERGNVHWYCCGNLLDARALLDTVMQCGGGRWSGRSVGRVPPASSRPASCRRAPGRGRVGAVRASRC